jgi:hypothetical protein
MKLNYKYLFLCLTALLVYSACVKKKVYSQSPEIEYKDFYPFQVDSADLVIGFSDGDGDIGSDGERNLFITYYYKDSVTGKYTGYYDATNNDTTRFTYAVKKPTDNYNGKSISGEVAVTLESYRHSKKAKNIKYTIYLVDQAGHRSNVVTTPEIVVP